MKVGAAGGESSQTIVKALCWSGEILASSLSSYFKYIYFQRCSQTVVENVCTLSRADAENPEVPSFSLFRDVIYADAAVKVWKAAGSSSCAAMPRLCLKTVNVAWPTETPTFQGSRLVCLFRWGVWTWSRPQVKRSAIIGRLLQEQVRSASLKLRLWSRLLARQLCPPYVFTV